MRAGKAVAAFFGYLLLGMAALPCAGPAGGTVSPPPPPADAFFPPVARTPGLLLSQVYAHAARDDEFVEIANVGRERANLLGWSLSDGEATATFPYGVWLAPGARIVVTRNATSYKEDLLQPADFTWDRGDVPRIAGGVLRLADAGDEILLLDPTGAVADAHVYGTSAYAGPGWSGGPARATGRGEVAVRSWADGKLTDTDTAEDWDGMRDHRIGQSAFEARTVLPEGPARAFVSPSGARDALLGFLGSAREALDVAVYVLTDEGIAASLARAARRGIAVRILLDGSPVGGLDADAVRIARSLAGAGVDVRWLDGGGDVVKRYRYLHAKYAIADGSSVWIGSENFGPAGFPDAGERGNRGWAVVVQDSTIAGQLRRVFDEDFDPRRRDSIAVEPSLGDFLPAARDPPPWSPGTGSRPTAARVVVAPDTALEPEGLLGLLASARDRIWIEAFYLEPTWRDAPNPFLEAAFAAAHRGVHVRILLDGSWWNDSPDSAGNDDVVETLNARALSDGVPFEARLIPPYGRVERVHNKGVLVDGRAVLVSSMNWAHASATENREVGVLLEDPGIAATFEAALWEDWTQSPRDDGFTIDDPAAVAVLYGIVAAASAASLRILRGTGKGLKPRAWMGRRGPLRGLLRGRRGEVRLLSLDLVAEPKPRPRGRRRTRGRGTEARGDRGGPEGD